MVINNGATTKEKDPNSGHRFKHLPRDMMLSYDVPEVNLMHVTVIQLLGSFIASSAEVLNYIM